MRSRKARFNTPLKIDVSKLASYFPEFRYRGPFINYAGDAITSEYIVNDASFEKCQILFFDDKTDDGFNTVLSAYSPKELAILFSKLPANISNPLIEALKGTSLEIPTLSEREYKEINAKFVAQEIRYKKLLSLRKRLIKTTPVNFKRSEAATVLQHEYAITTATDNQPVLGTFGAGPCLILALYDKVYKTAILAHIDSMTDIHSLLRLFDLVSKEHSVAHLAGGNSYSQDFCMDIVELLENNKIKIVYADIVRDSFDPASFAIDSRTGEIYSSVAHYQLTQTSDMNLRLQLARLQLAKSPLRQHHIRSQEKSILQATSASSISNPVLLPTMPHLPTEFSESLFLKMANQVPQIDRELGNSLNDFTPEYAGAIFVLAAVFAYKKIKFVRVVTNAVTSTVSQYANSFVTFSKKLTETTLPEKHSNKKRTMVS